MPPPLRLTHSLAGCVPQKDVWGRRLVGWKGASSRRRSLGSDRVLAEEGVAFTGNSASPRQRLTPKQLRALVTH